MFEILKEIKHGVASTKEKQALGSKKLANRNPPNIYL